MTTNASILGMSRDITPQSLHRFDSKYGRTPNIYQVTLPADLGGNRKGYFAPKQLLTRCGERIEADFFEPEFNNISCTDTPDPKPSTPNLNSMTSHALILPTPNHPLPPHTVPAQSKKVNKLPTFGFLRI